MIENMEYRHVSIGQLETRLADDEDGTFAGYANIHGILDSYGTRFAPGAWVSGGLEGRRVMLWMHSPDEPIGVFTAREDDHGLFIEGRYDDTVEGERARRRARSGSAPELSVGFLRRSVDAEDENLITAAELKEVSAITLGFASQPGAELTAVRTAARIMARMDERTGEDPVELIPQGVVSDIERPMTVANPGEALPVVEVTPAVEAPVVTEPTIGEPTVAEPLPVDQPLQTPERLQPVEREELGVNEITERKRKVAAAKLRLIGVKANG